MESPSVKWLLLERRSEGVDLFLEPRFRKETSNFNPSSIKTTPFSEKGIPQNHVLLQTANATKNSAF